MTKNRTHRFFYGYAIVLAAFFIMMVMWGIHSSFGVFFKPLVAEFGWTRDLKAVIDYLWALPEVDRSHLSLLGFSAGAAVSIYVAAQDNRVSTVASCACPAEFTSLIEADDLQSVINRFRDIGAIRDKDFPPSVDDWVGGFRLVNPVRYVAEIAPRPLLLVYGNKDEVVDVGHAYKLYAGAREPKQIIVVDGAGHRLRQNDRAMAIVIDWLKSQSL